MADGARHSMAYCLETDYAATPSNPVWKALRIVSTTLALTKDDLESEEIRSDRELQDSRHGARKVGGEVATELSYGSHDDFIEAVLCGTWAFPTITASTISAAASDNSFNDSGSGFLKACFRVGQKVTVTGWTGGQTANNITHGVIATLTAGKMTISGTIGDAIVDGTVGTAITITAESKVLKGGTTRRSFSIERIFNDLTTGKYLRFKGNEVAKWGLQVTNNAIVKSTFTILGQDMDAPADSALSGATYPAAATTSPLDSFSGTLSEGGALMAEVTEIQMETDGGMEARFVVGSKVSLRPSVKKRRTTGTATLYFDDVTMLTKFVNETESSLSFTMPDGAGNSYIVTLPRIKYSGGQPDVKGEGPITLPMPFKALRDSVTGTSIIVEKIDASS